MTPILLRRHRFPGAGDRTRWSGRLAAECWNDYHPIVTMNRPLNLGERCVLEALISGAEGADHLRLLNDMDEALVRPVNSDGSILEFVYEDYERPDQGQMAVGHEGVLLDADGVKVAVILYWDRNRRLCEFELLRTGEEEILSPQWDSFRLGGR